MDIAAISGWGAQAVVTLMPKAELESVKAGRLGEALRENNIRWFHLPIEDVDVPGRVWEEAWTLASPLLWRILNSGGRVLLHCRGGLGRAGTVAAMLLVEDGMMPPEAIRRVRTARPGAIETPAQEAYVRAHVTPRVAPVADLAHLEVFLRCQFDPQGVFGRAPAAWARHVFARSEAPAVGLALDVDRIGRERLHQMRNEGASPERLFLSTMAWGGMKVSHGSAAWAMRSFWSDAIQQAVAGGSTRQELFAIFNARRVPGMRAAYFTKLIHFCQNRGAEPIGYIMDQWTAKSINLIWGKPIVRLEASNWVHPENDETVYETFCQKVDALALILGVSGSEAEERLFSRGGRTASPWRRHLRAPRPRGCATVTT